MANIRRPQPPSPLARVSTEELLMELRRRIITPRDRRRERWEDWEDGLEAQGNWPEEG